MVKLLIVEDDLFLAKMYLKKFQIAGYQVDVAHDGVEALSKIKVFLPKVVLMDILMPKLNGLETLDIMKADPGIKNIPVIMLTNLSTTDDAETALNKGAVKYIIKSEVTPSEVVKVVAEILSTHQV